MILIPTSTGISTKPCHELKTLNCPLCLIHNKGAYLLQNRLKEDWNGHTFPGGHIEPGESIVDAAVPYKTFEAF